MPTLEVREAPPTAAGTPVWDRLWAHPHSDLKDDALLERERRSRRWALIVGHLEATFGSIRGLSTIELGSGRGDLSALLAARGANATLLDTSEKALDQARRRFDRLELPAQFEKGDMLGTLDAFRGRFDAVLSSGVIEHFRGDDRTRVVRAHYDVLRPGGLAVISVPNARCGPYRVWKSYLELRGWWPYGMELPYAKRELVRRARQAGFARVEAHCMDFRRSLAFGRSNASLARLTSRRKEMVHAPVDIPILDTVFGLILLLFGWRSSADPPPGHDGDYFLRRGCGAEFEMEADWVRASLPPGEGVILDVGCGNGSLFDVIGTHRAIGFDHCAGGLTYTRQRFPSIPLLCADASRLPLSSGSLRGLTAQHVVEHLSDYEQACREWHRVLKPGGTLLLLTPNARFCDPDIYQDPTHVHLFERDDLRNILVRVGFVIVDVRTIGLSWFRRYHGIPCVWQLRRFVTRRARLMSALPFWRWKGQTLCCAARRAST